MKRGIDWCRFCQWHDHEEKKCKAIPGVYCRVLNDKLKERIMRRFFVTNITVACNATKMEEALAAELRQYEDCILSEKAVYKVKENIEKKQTELKAANPRWRLADVFTNIGLVSGGFIPYHYLRVGCSVSLMLREVKKEIKADGE